MWIDLACHVVWQKNNKISIKKQNSKPYQYLGPPRTVKSEVLVSVLSENSPGDSSVQSRFVIGSSQNSFHRIVSLGHRDPTPLHPPYH